MRIIESIAELRALKSTRPDVTLVPTMGNLHEGHLSLVRMARARPGLVVTSLFVNPLQFAPHEDFERYPRTFEQDCDLLAKEGCDVLFAPSVAQMYPVPQSIFVEPPAELADILEGRTRPGFFRGVCTVVLKLFNLVEPRAAVFGRKDYQQWVIVRRMVQDLALDIEILGGRTVREPGGLALSSRNGYLSAAERREAAQLHQHLRETARRLEAGDRDLSGLEASAMASLASRGWQPDYISIRRARDLAVPSSDESGDWVVLGAAQLGGTRLIDNVELERMASKGSA
ncbi:MAG TPA: pantoate--beta-alanine ligase [Steroidobacteraceae bacterium]|nr:pantoate--beta-alanine ligase [Steroidobacteraceae bacterium]